MFAGTTEVYEEQNVTFAENEIPVSSLPAMNTMAMTWETTGGNIFAIQATRFLTFQVGHAIHQFYFPVIVLVGMIGNTFSLLVMVQRNNRHISCCVYMGALAVTDFLVLAMGGYYWIKTVVLSGLVQWECSYIGYLFHVNIDAFAIFTKMCHDFIYCAITSRKYVIILTIVGHTHKRCFKYKS